ncbi:hypothetical protein E0Z10_g5863 [Xylaria hypoxylon]|uniref:BRCT domain-containing protein n=1 Tax=Xylaria hypoxylon TaxID=37992 RepID=A0A4Z0YUV2_9PEZI|nr:hypothetical protein E0Z10_g5863 [Xylaria hypoxylon]
MSSNTIFKDCIVSIAGDLNDYRWSEEKVKQWVRHWGGTFSSIVDANVTHLLCTEENFKKKITSVRVALNNKVTKIVLRDWLEDSINKKVCLKALPYQLDNKAKQEEAKKRKLQKMENMSKNAEKYVDEQGFWNIYRDSTYFEYQVQLTRNDEESGNVRENHLLTLWESKAKPYNYICTTLYTKAKHKGIPLALNDSPVDFDAAFKKFKSFFKKRANISWNDRIEKMSTAGPEYYQYQPPSGGKPVGLMGRRHPSISSEHSHGSDLAASNQTEEEEQHNDGLVGETNAADTLRKRQREEHVTDDVAMDADDEERSAKKLRYEEVETEADAAGQSSVINLDCEVEGGIQNDQGHDWLSGDDDNGVHRIQPESSNVMNDGTSEPYNGFDGYEQEHDSSDEYDTANGDGLVAPCNSEAGDEQNDGGSVDTTLTYNEVQYPEVVDDYYSYDVDDNVDADHDTSPESISARAAAENIYYESMRGVSLVNDSQAELIDIVRQEQAFLRARAEKLREQERMSESEDDY